MKSSKDLFSGKMQRQDDWKRTQVRLPQDIYEGLCLYAKNTTTALNNMETPMKSKALLLSLILPFGSFISTPALAVSEDECAIWLCAPGGFPEGCSAAKSAMIKRIKKGKSPLPDFSSCAVKDETTGSDPKDFTYTFNRVIRIREHKVCTHKILGDRKGGYSCMGYKTIPAHDRAGYSCYIRRGKDDDPEYIKGCIGSFYRIKIFEKGVQLGETYYFN